MRTRCKNLDVERPFSHIPYTCISRGIRVIFAYECHRVKVFIRGWSCLRLKDIIVVDVILNCVSQGRQVHREILELLALPDSQGSLVLRVFKESLDGVESLDHPGHEDPLFQDHQKFRDHQDRLDRLDHRDLTVSRVTPV